MARAKSEHFISTENEQNEYIELIPKPIPSLFNKDDTAGQWVMGFFIAFMVIVGCLFKNYMGW